MAPQGRLGCAAGAALAGRFAAAGWLAGLAGAALFAGGVASRCVTWLDCLPNDLPPMRLAQASAEPITMAQTNTIDNNFVISVSKKSNAYVTLSPKAKFNI
jgi:hypothetical protein